MNLDQSDWHLKQTDEEEKRAHDEWSRAVKTEANVELRAERFRRDVDARKQELFPSTKWLRFFAAFKELFK